MNFQQRDVRYAAILSKFCKLLDLSLPTIFCCNTIQIQHIVDVIWYNHPYIRCLYPYVNWEILFGLFNIVCTVGFIAALIFEVGDSCGQYITESSCELQRYNSLQCQWSDSGTRCTSSGAVSIKTIARVSLFLTLVSTPATLVMYNFSCYAYRILIAAVKFPYKGCKDLKPSNADVYTEYNKLMRALEVELKSQMIYQDYFRDVWGDVIPSDIEGGNHSNTPHPPNTLRMDKSEILYWLRRTVHVWRSVCHSSSNNRLPEYNEPGTIKAVRPSELPDNIRPPESVESATQNSRSNRPCISRGSSISVAAIEQLSHSSSSERTRLLLGLFFFDLCPLDVQWMLQYMRRFSPVVNSPHIHSLDNLSMIGHYDSEMSVGLKERIHLVLYFMILCSLTTYLGVFVHSSNVVLHWVSTLALWMLMHVVVFQPLSTLTIQYCIPYILRNEVHSIRRGVIRILRSHMLSGLFDVVDHTPSSLLFPSKRLSQVPSDLVLNSLIRKYTPLNPLFYPLHRLHIKSPYSEYMLKFLNQFLIDSQVDNCSIVGEAENENEDNQSSIAGECNVPAPTLESNMLESKEQELISPYIPVTNMRSPNNERSVACIISALAQQQYSTFSSTEPTSDTLSIRYMMSIYVQCMDYMKVYWRFNVSTVDTMSYMGMDILINTILWGLVVCIILLHLNLIYIHPSAVAIPILVCIVCSTCYFYVWYRNRVRSGKEMPTCTCADRNNELLKTAFGTRLQCGCCYCIRHYVRDDTCVYCQHSDFICDLSDNELLQVSDVGNTPPWSRVETSAEPNLGISSVELVTSGAAASIGVIPPGHKGLDSILGSSSKDSARNVIPNGKVDETVGRNNSGLEISSEVDSLSSDDESVVIRVIDREYHYSSVEQRAKEAIGSWLANINMSSPSPGKRSRSRRGSSCQSDSPSPSKGGRSESLVRRHSFSTSQTDSGSYGISVDCSFSGNILTAVAPSPHKILAAINSLSGNELDVSSPKLEELESVGKREDVCSLPPAPGVKDTWNPRDHMISNEAAISRYEVTPQTSTSQILSYSCTSTTDSFSSPCEKLSPARLSVDSPSEHLDSYKKAFTVRETFNSDRMTLYQDMLLKKTVARLQLKTRRKTRSESDDSTDRSKRTNSSLKNKGADEAVLALKNRLLRGKNITSVPPDCNGSVTSGTLEVECDAREVMIKKQVVHEGFRASVAGLQENMDKEKQRSQDLLNRRLRERAAGNSNRQQQQREEENVVAEI